MTPLLTQQEYDAVWSRLTRAVVFAIGCAIAINEAFLAKTTDPSLLFFAGGLMATPVALGFDVRRNSNGPPPPPDTGTGP